MQWDWKLRSYRPPTVFELNDQNKAVVLDPNSAGEETLMEAAESCPVNALIIKDDEGNQLYP
jgi:ferredoxin